MQDCNGVFVFLNIGRQLWQIMQFNEFCSLNVRINVICMIALAFDAMKPGKQIEIFVAKVAKDTY